MKSIVISQPMFFPWVGMFEQMRLADVYVHYDDVQFSKGSFTNRVQIKTAQGIRWLSMPLRDLHLGQEIRDVLVDDRQDWRRKHLQTLEQAYAGALFRDEMLGLADEVYRSPADRVSDLAAASMEALRRYFGLANPSEILWSSRLRIPGESSARVLAIVKLLGGNVYITGHGARNYLDHELFEREGVRVEYLDYEKLPYPQLHGEFTPYVSALDLIANQGSAGVRVICSTSLLWRDFLNKS